jgi:AraC-like DNA-binding protein
VTARESDFEMPLPGGSLLRAHRSVTRLPGGLSWIEEEMEIRGRFGGPFVTGPGWILERHVVSAGAACYLQDGARVPIASRSFGLLYAPFAITELLAGDLRTRWVGLAGEGPAPADEPIVFDVPRDARPRTPAEMLALVAGARDIRSFARCTAPSPVSRRAKALLDASYRSATTVASLAARLGVSHPHLTRRFKRDYGLAPLAYRHALRAGEAARRLSKGEPIVDVSGEVGYEDLGRFYKAFRKAMRSSPGRCRMP